MSNKNIEKHLVGQPVFKQIIDLIPHNKFELLVKRAEGRPLLQDI